MAKNEQAIIDIIIKGQKANASLNEMDRAVRALSSQLKKLPKETQEFADKKAELQKMSKNLKDIQNDVKGVGGVFQSIGKEIKGFGIMAAGYLGFQWLTSSVNGIIKSNAQLSDSLADIRKTTGMTEAEAKKLNTAFSQINTRTATKELRDIAIVGGQLGIAKKDILGFTLAMDKMNVSLGDEFTGGAEEITKSMGGLRNIFTDIKSDKVDQDLLHIGNAINELASSGAATGPVVADFANRIGGVGITLGLTSGQVLGLSATLQEMGVSTERGGTAVTRILQKMTTHTEDFYKVAKDAMDPKKNSFEDFKEMVNKDLYGAFVKVVEGSKLGGQSAVAFGNTLDSLGVDGAGASEVFAKLGSNTAMLNEKVGLANTSLKGTSSIMNEFNIKNRDAAADLEKISKGVAAWFSNSTASDWLKSITGGLADLFDKTSEADKLTNAWREQKEVVENLETSMVPLLNRHDELKAKSTLTKDEQIELDKIVAKVAETVPFAVTEFDKYGKALDINTSKGRDFIAMEKDKAEILNKDALFERRKELIEITKLAEVYRKALDMKDSEGDFYKIVTSQKTFGKEAEFTTKNVKLTNEEVKNLRDNLQKLRDKQIAISSIIDDLTGKMVETGKTAKEVITTNTNTLTAEQVEAAKKAADEWAKFLEKLKELGHEQELDAMKLNDREYQVIKDKYNKLRVEAKGHSKELKTIQSLEDTEIMAMLFKQFERESAAETKEYKEKINRLHKLGDEKEKIISSIPKNEKNQTEEQKLANETAKISKEFDERIKDAEEFNAGLYEGEEGFAIDIEQLHVLKFAAIEALTQKHHENIDAKNQKKFQKEVDQFKNVYGYAAQVYDQFAQLRKNGEERELKEASKRYNAEKNHYKRLLDGKAITQKEYDKKIAKLEADKEAKELDIKRKQELREKRAAIIKATINTAVAVAEQAPNYVLMALTAALGAIQIGVIASQPSAYAKGGYNRKSNDPQGFTTGPTLYTQSASGKPFIAGEAGTEYIIPNWMVNDPVIGPQIDDLERIRTKGYVSGGYNTDVPMISDSSNKSTQMVYQSDPSLIAAVNTLNSILAEGIQARLNHDILVKDQSAIDSAKKSAQVG